MLGVFMLLDYLLRRFHENFFKINQKPVSEEGAPWQLACEKLELRCGYLLTLGLWTDCTFMVGSETNQELIQAHKLLLAMASPVFERLFFGGPSERNDPIVPIPDIQPETFKALLQYIYTGNMNISSLNMAWNMLYGAKKYMLPHLEKECISYIWSEIGQRKAGTANEFAHIYDEKTLLDYIQIISKNSNEVPNDSSFDDVALNILTSVSSLDHLNMDSKLDLFYAVARYAEEEQRRQGEISSVDQEQTRLEPPTSEEKGLLIVERSCQTSPVLEIESKQPTEVFTSKPTAEKENLKVQELAAGQARSGVLTDAESTLIESIASSFSDVTIPAGCSGSRERRQPRSDSNEQCFEAGSIEHIINELKSGDPSRVKPAVEAASNILRTPRDIQPALEKGILDALVPALTEGVYSCKEEAARAIFYLCEWGSVSQLGVLAASVALQPYCQLLRGGGDTCYYVLCGLTHLLQKVEQQNTETLRLKLEKFEVHHSLILLQQFTSGMSCKLATNLLQTYFGTHIHSDSAFVVFG